MRALCSLFLLFLLGTTGCSVKDSRHSKSSSLDVSSGKQMPTNESPITKDQRLEVLKRAADVVLETKDWLTVEIVTPKPERPTQIPVSNLSRHLPSKDKHGYAVVLVPQSGLFIEGQKSGDEVIIDIAESVRRAGFQPVFFLTLAQGLWTEIYPDGIPSRKEAQQKKREILKATQ